MLGTLSDQAPDEGEDVHPLVSLAGARIEHIVSSGSVDPGEQVQAWDEWVLVTHGRGQLGLPAGVVELGPGDWVLIPAGTPHRVLQTAPGTQWIAVHDQAGEPLSIRP